MGLCWAAPVVAATSAPQVQVEVSSDGLSHSTAPRTGAVVRHEPPSHRGGGWGLVEQRADGARAGNVAIERRIPRLPPNEKLCTQQQRTQGGICIPFVSYLGKGDCENPDFVVREASNMHECIENCIEDEKCYFAAYKEAKGTMYLSGKVKACKVYQSEFVMNELCDERSVREEDKYSFHTFMKIWLMGAPDIANMDSESFFFYDGGGVCADAEMVLAGNPTDRKTKRLKEAGGYEDDDEFSSCAMRCINDLKCYHFAFSFGVACITYKEGECPEPTRTSKETFVLFKKVFR